MKKLCLILAVLLVLLSGCGKDAGQIAATQSPTVSENPWVSFDIYAVNDLHGKLADSDAQPGVDELSTYLKQAENRILLSTGDMWQGASESNLTNGLIVTEWMNELDFTAMTLGGHEYDWGEEWIRENRQLAEFPFLGINIYNRDTGEQVDYCQSSVVVEMDGVQVGIIGAIGNCYVQAGDTYFKTGDELTALVKAEAERLRAEGADCIVYAIHAGLDKNTSDTKPETISSGELAEYYDTVLSDGYVDVVFEADSHYRYVLQDDCGVYHLQGGSNNSGLAHVRVLVNKKTGEVSVATAELLPAAKYSYMEDDPVVAQLMEKYAVQIAPATQILGVNGQYRNGSQLCLLVAELYCETGVERWGAQYDIVLGGGYISCRSPGYLPAGEVSYSQLQALLPFDNQIVLCSIRGRDLIDKFLQTDNDAYYIQLAEYGDRIADAIDPDGTYYVVTDTYTSDYTYNRLTVVARYDGDVFARDLVAEHIAKGELD